MLVPPTSAMIVQIVEPGVGVAFSRMTKPWSPFLAHAPRPASTRAKMARRMESSVKIVSRWRGSAQNSLDLRDRQLDGLTRTHLAHEDESQLVADPLLVDLDAGKHVLGQIRCHVVRQAGTPEGGGN